MKKRSDKDIKAHISENPAEIFAVMDKCAALRRDFPDGTLPWPFSEDMLSLLKNGNPLSQRYYFIEKGGSYAFFTVYTNKMDLFTFGRARLMMKIQTVAFPCSLSCGGYITNDLQFMLGYIKTIRGCKLVLNLPEPASIKGMSRGETLPTCKLTLLPCHTDTEAYLNSLRSPYRRRINLAVKKCGDITVRQINDGSINIHPLYLQTFSRSDYKLEQLEQVFFDRVEGDRLVFMKNGEPAGFVLLKQNGSELVFMLCGMDYRYETADLYYYMLLRIVDYAIAHGCSTIDFGQTSEKTKLKFGAVLEKRFFCAHHSNPLLNLAAMAGKHILEYKYSFPEFHVFKGEK